ncbi:T9SS type A sorting domain-containing protein [Flammeovirga yaeyamensis]|uniref:T9SS type A sorting domain-containing protein n=1 Tax=Flammeovirga yaeyamensis TaxID=367791 RepID=A0AAX1MYZ4_9BACT|nr:T9SS type A sorting domain-containing protein [Flammeovirga yaeyamensis]MBB3696025.1 hypothetical protein [Flammeovirga yaeyamensis]NMF34711.1 T9SS type A sorting domain-containing protein [Flammeovirga yaeyamensis]QWG00460.1 T9SS type A sorting domain-containing protein [Flammeovirga yaeyamensis]
MKKIFYISLTMLFISFTSVMAQEVASITVKCPPCRPVQSCDQCYETQAAADLACGSSARTSNLDLKNDLEELTINAFPNPSFEGKFTIESTSLLNGSVKLYSQVGALIQELNLSDTNRFKLGEDVKLSSGIYIMTYTDVNGNVISKRLVVDY